MTEEEIRKSAKMYNNSLSRHPSSVQGLTEVLVGFALLLQKLNKHDVIRRFLEEMAGKHKVKVDALNIHISEGTLYIQEYNEGRYEKYKTLEIL